MRKVIYSLLSTEGSLTAQMVRKAVTNCNKLLQKLFRHMWEQVKSIKHYLCTGKTLFDFQTSKSMHVIVVGGLKLNFFHIDGYNNIFKQC